MMSNLIMCPEGSEEKTFALYSLGCRVNTYESEGVREGLLALGYQERSFSGEADVYLVHSCAVTAESERKSRSAVSRALRKKAVSGARVCVFGCMGQKRSEALYQMYPALDLVFGTGSLSSLPARVDALVCEREAPVRERVAGLTRAYDTPGISSWHSPRAFLKIQDGCNSFCTYCIVPFLRGRERNRPQEEILAEAQRLCASGAREIVLTGIETAAFGAENLVRLSERLSEIPTLSRIRFGSLKPTLFTQDFCRSLASLEKVMPHFHLSVQSASDAVLARMGRNYTKAELYRAVEEIRNASPTQALSADLICGFPGESEADFEESLAFLRDASLLHVHVFPYSVREGTKAATMENQVEETVKRARVAQMLALAGETAEREYAKLLPLEGELLTERVAHGELTGHTEHFLSLRLSAQRGDRVGELVRIKERKVL